MSIVYLKVTIKNLISRPRHFASLKPLICFERTGAKRCPHPSQLVGVPGRTVPRGISPLKLTAALTNELRPYYFLAFGMWPIVDDVTLMSHVMFGK